MASRVGTTIRLAFRMHRFELLALAVFVTFLFAASYWVAGQLDAVGFGACMTDTGVPSDECESLGRRFYRIQESQAQPLLGLLGVMPFATGLFLGAPVISREIERGTTRLAWSLAPSRLRWYARRALPVVAAVIVIAFAAGIAADRLTAAIMPNLDLSRSFDYFGQRGSLVAVTALVMTAGAIGLGAVIGKVLPTMIFALVLGAAGLAGVSSLHRDFTAGEAILVDGENWFYQGDRFIDQFFKLPDGRLVGWQELEQIDPEAMMSEEGPQYPTVSLVIPGARYREVEAREAAIFGAIALVMLVGTAAVIQRRRPG